MPILVAPYFQNKVTSILCQQKEKYSLHLNQIELGNNYRVERQQFAKHTTNLHLEKIPRSNSPATVLENSPVELLQDC
ncbi:MAG: hypothetical protein BWY67_01618 [Bacteroidetes bacterium ADurb.Bin397]|nr:MAG: hypothetical protein BWY67_01618 [Bacteroidetes bacterium ADurb.Bin397]